MSPHQNDPGHSLPEVDPQQGETYLYPVPKESTQYASHPNVVYEYRQPLEDGQYIQGSNRARWTRWYILLIFGLAIALLSGLIGGFIGQAIQKSREPSNTSSASQAATPSTPASTSVPTPASGTQDKAVIGNITRPDTGCSWPSKQRRKIENKTFHKPSTSYTTLCNTGWPATELIAMWALTPSDCVESCAQYNAMASAAKRPSSERQCVGAGFIPDWTNQTIAARESNGQAFNCYLQNSTDGIMSNDRAAANVEVVALCLPGRCDHIDLS